MVFRVGSKWWVGDGVSFVVAFFLFLKRFYSFFYIYIVSYSSVFTNSPASLATSETGSRPLFKTRMSTKRFALEVRTSVEVGSSAAEVDGMRMNSRIEMCGAIVETRNREYVDVGDG